MAVLDIQNPTIRSFVYGSVSGTCSTVLFQPLDLIKTRMQRESLHERRGIPKDLGMVQIAMDVVRKEKVFGLWRGTVPSLIRCVPGIGLYFGTLDFLKNEFCTNPSQPKPLEAISLGLTSRALTVVTLLPVTVIKTRYESGLFTYSNIWTAFLRIYRSEGLHGSFRGLLPTLVRDMPFSGLYYLSYSQLKILFDVENPESSQYLPRSFKTFSCGLISGLFASTVTHPADVVKTRVQIDYRNSTNLFQAILAIVRTGDYFRGLVPRVIRRTLMTALTWTIFEVLIHPTSERN